MVKKKNDDRGLKFGDCQNIIDQAISTRVNCISDLIIPTYHDSSGDLEEIVQHDIVPEDNINDGNYADNNDNISDQITNGEHSNRDDRNNEVAVVDREDQL